jgi:two-component system response regulator LytT
MRILIVEDEQLAAERLERLLQRLEPNCTILTKVDSVGSAIEWIENEQPDLIMLDIHLSDGSGFELFEHITVKSPVIFTTAYDQYALEAFKVNSLDYLLKPIKKADLQRSLDQYREHYQQTSQVQDNLEALLNAFQKDQPTYKKRLLVQLGEKLKAIPTADIAYAYAQQKAVWLRLFDGSEYPVNYSLKELADLLDPQQFFRINRQFMLNFDAITQMHQYPKGRVKIDLDPTPDDLVIVSVERAKDFKAWLEGVES